MSQGSFITEKLEHWATNTPSRPALVSGTGSSINYAELREVSRQLASQLRDAGIGRADFVALALPHNPYAVVAPLALLREQVVGLSIPQRESSVEVIAKLTSGTFRGAVIAKGAPFGPMLKTHGWSGGQLTGLPLELWLAPEYRPSLEFRERDVRWTLSTSGTTGIGRTVMISESNLSERTLGEIELFGIESGAHVLNWLTFAHDLGLNQMLTSIFAGATLNVSAFYSSAEIERLMSSAPHPGMTGTPLIWREFLAEVPHREIVGPKYLTISGGIFSDEETSRLQSYFPHAHVFRTYGQTETFRSLSNGRPIAGVKLELTSDGELIHRGPGTMSGYFGAPEATTMKMTADGGVKTGDYFKVHGDGRFIFEGRRDDIVKHFDFRLALGEVEQTIRTHPNVTDVAVVKLPGATDTDLVAFVSGREVSGPEIRAYCQGLVSRHKVPDQVVIVREFPRTAIGKIDRVKLLGNWEAENADG